jgi:hypothetical protein
VHRAKARKVNAMAVSQSMTSPVRPLDLSVASAALWLSATTFLALLVIYFVGIDQGAVSVFGGDMHVHEFMHDGRHLLGFPCH